MFWIIEKKPATCSAKANPEIHLLALSVFKSTGTHKSKILSISALDLQRVKSGDKKTFQIIMQKYEKLIYISKCYNFSKFVINTKL